ncbi:hypothetical protein [uncultured Oscillibacter sp.]|uniref:hypothetical protein n=1 Tax=uncultured Oscillibacter sp. TaxID=876091 RepID=UPI00260EC323|nr:hypothetical protein [uncultured Oscillibacter sp.]
MSVPGISNVPRRWRNWKNGLLPLLTCLTVAGLTLLPLRLSALEDRRLTGVVHSEELGEDSSFPARTPDLPGRLWLLAQRNSLPEHLTIVEQILEGEELDRTAALALAGLRELEESGVLPEGLTGDIEGFSGSRMFLRDQSDLSSASFVEMSTYVQKTADYLQLCLDGESGRILSLEVYSILLAKNLTDAETVGQTFLDGLGCACEFWESYGGEAVFRVLGTSVLYMFRQFGENLGIYPYVDLNAYYTDADRREALGLGNSSTGVSYYDG